MVKLCQQDQRVVGITAAMPSGTGLKALEKAMPHRYFDVGIAEEHAVIFAAGMAAMGLRPVVAIYSTFLQRGYDAIIHDVALQDLPVIFCLDRAGLSANDGPTHHGLFDIAFLRCVPRVIGMAPSNEDELVDMLFSAAGQPHPAFIRYPRGTGEGVPIKAEPKLLEIGKAEVVQNFSAPPPLRAGAGRTVAFLALGPMLGVAREAAAQLAREGCDCALINARFFKPLDAELTERFARNADVVVTLEDHVLTGGYGSAVLELLTQRHLAAPVVRLGWPDQFIEHATTVEHLREKYDLTAAQAVAQVKSEFRRLRKAERPLVAAMA
jgi:1-deoxy-D-xylulose-5-phosphate synthase